MPLHAAPDPERRRSPCGPGTPGSVVHARRHACAARGGLVTLTVEGPRPQYNQNRSHDAGPRAEQTPLACRPQHPRRVCQLLPDAPGTPLRGPVAMTGPVGCPVGEPPGGSTDTASMAVAAIRASNVAFNGSTLVAPGANTPTEIGDCPAGISQSWVLRPLGMAVLAAGTRMTCLRSRSTVAVQSVTPFWRMVETIRCPLSRTGPRSSNTAKAIATTEAARLIHCQGRALDQKRLACEAACVSHPSARRIPVHTSAEGVICGSVSVIGVRRCCQKATARCASSLPANSRSTAARSGGSSTPSTYSA